VTSDEQHTSGAAIDAAIAAVRRAADACSRAHGRLAAGETLTKGDDSPVTVADFAAQAIVCATLQEQLGAVAVVGEEDAADLATPDAATLADGVADLVSDAMGERVDVAQVRDWIGIGGADPSNHPFWTLDPIDGTKGFVRGDQYAIALALIERGEVVLGVLGCPNLPNADGSIGALFIAANGRTEMTSIGDGSGGRPIAVARPASTPEARFCESVESGHSDQGWSAAVAERLGITSEPYRIDSQCKYAAVARGDASIYLRLPTRADYVEKIWDHAAGKLVVEWAGGRVTDIDGRPLDFGRGARLAGNRGVVATSGAIHDEVVAAVLSAEH
jgi:3'(2'), 5'-bisphosphate nucleotidase